MNKDGVMPHLPVARRTTLASSANYYSYLQQHRPAYSQQVLHAGGGGKGAARIIGSAVAGFTELALFHICIHFILIWND
jgi:hypothetical protein